MTVNLTRIYTRLGDSGETHLGDMSRVPEDPSADRGLRDGRRAERADRARADDRGPAAGLRRLAAAGSRTTCSTSAPTSRRPRTTRARAPAGAPRADGVARGALRRGQRDARAAQVVRAPRRHAGPPRSCTSAGRSAGAPSGSRSPAATSSTPRSCATSTGSRTCCSSSAGAPTAATSRCGSRAATAVAARRQRRTLSTIAVDSARPSAPIAAAPTTNASWAWA